jgi:hypothetical protein
MPSEEYERLSQELKELLAQIAKLEGEPMSSSLPERLRLGDRMEQVVKRLKEIISSDHF